MEESRLDRIEKDLAEFIRGVGELRESQKETGKQIRELRESQKETGKQIRESHKEAREQMRELRESQKEAGEQMQELRESHKEAREQMRELRKSQKETGEQIRELRESHKETRELLERTIERLDQVGRNLGDLGLVQGEIAEELFYRNLPSIFRDRKPPFHIIKRNLKKKGVAEYDIVATDGKDLLVVEVKNKLRKSMIDDFINKRLPRFKKAFPQYRDCRMTGGIGALVVKDDVGRYAEKHGLYVLTQTDDGGAVLMNRKTFKPKEFA